MRRGERRKGWRKFWKNDDKKTDEMDRKECRKMMKTNKGRRWKMKKSVGWGVCMKAIYCWAWPSTTVLGVPNISSPRPMRKTIGPWAAKSEFQIYPPAPIPVERGGPGELRFSWALAFQPQHPEKTAAGVRPCQESTNIRRKHWVFQEDDV